MRSRKSTEVSQSGFSLLELLVVLAIIAILVAMVAPPIGSALAAMKINTDSQAVAGEIDFARTSALAKNLPAEVWFIEENPGRAYRSIRVGLLDQDGSLRWISRAKHLSESHLFTRTAAHSNILSLQDREVMPGVLPETQGVALRIYPSGRAELKTPSGPPPGLATPLFITLIPSPTGDTANGELPANFATLHIDPMNARVQIHRP